VRASAARSLPKVWAKDENGRQTRAPARPASPVLWERRAVALRPQKRPRLPFAANLLRFLANRRKVVGRALAGSLVNVGSVRRQRNHPGVETFSASKRLPQARHYFTQPKAVATLATLTTCCRLLLA
jgi:hypothetical protein